MIINGSLIAAFLAGSCFVVVHSRVLHEASHFGLTNNQTLNRVLSYIYSFPTLCITSWELQHVINHHQYTNYMVEEDDQIQLADIDIASFDEINEIANRLPISKWMWSKLLYIVIPVIYVLSPIIIGINNAQSLVRNQMIVHDSGRVKVKSHKKFPFDALLLIIVQASIIGYMAYAHGV